jgi:hypothetical protein
MRRQRQSLPGLPILGVRRIKFLRIIPVHDVFEPTAVMANKGGQMVTEEATDLVLDLLLFRRQIGPAAVL